DPATLSRLQQDPRWWYQQLKRHAGPAGSALNPAPATAATTSLLENPLHSLVKGNAPTSKGNTKCKGPNCPAVDWGESLGISTGAFMGAGTYPAKYTFGINDTPDCINDFVVLPVNVTGIASIKASRAGTFTSAGAAINATSGGTAVIDGQTFIATGTLASQTGTVSTFHVADGGQTATVTNGGSIAVTASAPTKAINTGSFSSLLAPTSFSTFTNANSITVTNTSPANTLTLKTDATAAHETGSFSSPPFSTTSLTITNPSPSNTLTLTTSATTAQAIGTVSGPPTSTTAPTITVTNSAVSPSNILTLTTNATSDTASGTFSFFPASSTDPSITIGNTAN